eukprot:CAMPEP_0178955992 /NCGR_PEP_ID=MMETSP0789-20121207/9949_1 /TAXON_ID=3005 /ORGANISM="Rhizosolenia setigera, Strain CCMP 1694" /LENGTH=1418 /DNA_ID=CAMNT_0020637757 /DNA_START=123 /DNA_END=4379 /DNA_ORIENTATION=-
MTMRELKVEDALMYLDQVKMEFFDRPQIYNTFLDIMKTFKSQQIDTPGVIRRVSKLFQGNKKLILGFNTFLPEGYKIKLSMDTGREIAVYKVPGQSDYIRIAGTEMSGGQPAPPGPGQPQNAASSTQPQEQQQQQHLGMEHQKGSAPFTRPGGPGNAADSKLPPAATVPLSQRSRITGSSPLGVGRPQQQQNVQPHSSMGKPQQPEGLQHHAPQQQQQQQAQMRLPPHAQQQQQQVSQPSALDQQPHHAIPSRNVVASQQQQQPNNQQPGGPPPPPSQPVEFDHAINYVTTIKKRFASEPETYKSFLEILHTYQKEQRGIKEVLDEVSNLFADHPDLLQEFTYFLPDAVQAQAKAQLADIVKTAEARKRMNAGHQTRHPHTSASSMGHSQHTTSQSPYHHGQHTQPNYHAQPPVQLEGPPPIPIAFGATQGRTEDREREILHSAVHGLLSFQPARPPRRNVKSISQLAKEKGRPVSIPMPNQLYSSKTTVEATVSEQSFFERVKHYLGRKELVSEKYSSTRKHTPYAEFLKYLHLFSIGIINKDELLALVRDLLLYGHAPKTGANAGRSAHIPLLREISATLMRDFEYIILSHGPYHKQKQIKADNKAKFGCASLTKDVEFIEESDQQVTPSYFHMPKNYPCEEYYVHSGQTEADASVLNSEFVCVGSYTVPSAQMKTQQRQLFSPEDYNGPKLRKNECEDALYRIEDDRFEIDMAIERNASAMRALAPMAEETKTLKELEEKDGQPIGRLKYHIKHKINTNHLGAIARVYGGDLIGDEVLHHFARNPLAVTPIIFKRLQQKDQEWRNLRQELLEDWKLMVEENYQGSLDVLCGDYRRKLERSFNAEKMVEECKRAKHYAKENIQINKIWRTNAAPLFQLSSSAEENSPQKFYQSHIKLKSIHNDMPHKEAYDLISTLLGIKSKTPTEKEKIWRIWAEFVIPFFNQPTYWIAQDLRDKAALNNDATSGVAKFAPGQNVRTCYGDGTIVDIKGGGNNGSSFSTHSNNAQEDTTTASKPTPSSSSSDDDNNRFYKVQFKYGAIGFIRPCSIIHLMPGSDVPYARRGGFMEFVEQTNSNSENALGKDIQVLFGTEKMYLFLRMYCLLLSILEETQKSFESKNTNNNTMEGVEMKSDNGNNIVIGASSSTQSSTTDIRVKYKKCFHGIIQALCDTITQQITKKKFEICCRNIISGTQQKEIYKLAALPKLVEKCSDMLVKISREDLCLSLYDLSILASQHKDPVLLRQQTKEVTKDMQACYRIQYCPRTQEILFGFMNPDAQVLIHPKNSMSLNNNVNLASSSSTAPPENSNDSTSMNVDNNVTSTSTTTIQQQQAPSTTTTPTPTIPDTATESTEPTTKTDHSEEKESSEKKRANTEISATSTTTSTNNNNNSEEGIHNKESSEEGASSSEGPLNKRVKLK